MKLTSTQIRELILNAAAIAPTETKWLHKKGGIYAVVGYAFDTETEDVRILYRRIGGPDFNLAAEAMILFARPASEWTEDRFTLL